MKKLSIIQIIFTFMGALLLALIKNQYNALSFFVGGLVICFSVISWGISMTFIFQKKFIALSIGIIVFKYAILGVIIYWLVRQDWLQTIWFAMGVASFIITAFTYAILETLKEGKKEDKQDVI